MSTTRRNTKYALAMAAFAGCLALGVTGCNGCNSNAAGAPITNGQDPAMANMADTSYNAPTQVAGYQASYSPTQSGETYANGQQAPAPIVQGNQQQSYAYDSAPSDDNVYAEQAPPPLPEYDQPVAPGPNYEWTPGYWGWGGGGYYWVPGAWVAAPYYGALWTPPYWGYYGNRYYFHHGYWGPHIGFYGGVDYGFGYIGVGYFGGYWRGHDFWYNRAVTRIGGGWGGGHYYDRAVVYNNVRYGMQPMNRVSFNGGRGGINARPQGFEQAAMREQHLGPQAAQMQNHNEAMRNRGQMFSANGGRPQEMAMSGGLGNPREIRSTPQGVQVGRPGLNGQPAANHGGPQGNAMAGHEGGMQPGMNMQHGAAAMQAGHGMANMNGMNHGAENHGAPAAAQQHGFANAGGMNHAAPQAAQQQHGFANAGGMNRGAEANRGMEANRGAETHATMQHSAPQQMQQHAAPQVQRAAPQAERAAPQQHAAPQMQQHEAPQMHQQAAPQMHQQAAPQMHSAPAGGGGGHMGGGAPAGGGGHPGGGGGHPGGGGHH
ncbi:hypothetical protein ACFQBQ_08820 [Granulicella cerasi]|uniref:YXWGXW repeat-containing protein n=1 Tax=Granulicella cerasi TaxID=741063 RepID=A0ABW1Z8Z8_9BACT|nr:hypothetical protein [Granulicella cerasi]